MNMENYETDEVYVTTERLREEIMTTNYYILEGIKEGDRDKVMKYKIMLDNLIKIWLK